MVRNNKIVNLTIYLCKKLWRTRGVFLWPFLRKMRRCIRKEKEKMLKEIMVLFMFSIIFMVVSFALYTGKALKYMKSYEGLSDEEKGKIRIIPLCQNISVAILIAAIIFFIAGCSLQFRENLFQWFIVIWIIGCAINLWYIDKSKKYEN